MNHQFFEKKLLRDESFSKAEEKALQEHLLECAECAALAEVNFALRHAKAALPEAGFAERFSLRLAKRRKTERKKYFAGGLILLAGAATALIWLALPVVSLSAASSRFFVDFAFSLAAVLSFLRVMSEVGQVLFHIAAGFIPVAGWITSLAFFGGLTYLWFFSLLKAAKHVQSI